MHGTDQQPQPLNVTLKVHGKIKFAQCRILHALHKLHKKRATKTTVVQADSSITLIALSKAQSPFSQAIYKLVVFGLSMLNSNQTNHIIKLCNNRANQKCSHMSLQLTPLPRAKKVMNMACHFGHC